LRHYHASTLLQAGISPTAVAARLGHTVAVLLATYAHVMPDDDARIVAVLDKAFSRKQQQIRQQSGANHWFIGQEFNPITVEHDPASEPRGGRFAANGRGR